jgi:hypothetical protein
MHPRSRRRTRGTNRYRMHSGGGHACLNVAASFATGGFLRSRSSVSVTPTRGTSEAERIEGFALLAPGVPLTVGGYDDSTPRRRIFVGEGPGWADTEHRCDSPVFRRAGDEGRHGGSPGRWGDRTRGRRGDGGGAAPRTRAMCILFTPQVARFVGTAYFVRLSDPAILPIHTRHQWQHRRLRNHARTRFLRRRVADAGMGCRLMAGRFWLTRSPTG